ncbi:Fet3 protein [Vararia minispora EC-137]|uniref:Fet3 protein n=1 Tax=Vararia minispora EC-137 TaxID=1314806 RepID=A0ACB8QWQ8_9AGAM|nr:Fet3 protein [Vararia minispora EC-137]
MRPFLLLVAAASPAFAALKEVWWNITYVENTVPDGLVPRRAIGVNGTWPPPPLDINEDDYLIVHAHNSLSESTSLHHHGMFFNGTSWMDGAVGVSECGIPPNGDFDYHIAVNESGQVGTYWVHAHDNGHYTDGLRAPFLIHALNETHKYDDEFTVILSDWYHSEAKVLLKHFISIANPGGAEPVPNSGLLYFAQNGSYLGPISGSSPTGSSAAVGFNENATLPFQPGKTYRLRIVNVGAFAAQWFWIDGHQMRIIEVDGTDVEEFPINLIQIAVAQRYSILVTALNDTSANYAVHSNFDTTMFDTVPATLQSNMTGSITYDSSAPLTSGTIDAYEDLPDISLVPSTVVPMGNSSDRTIELEALFATMADGTNHAMFNLITYDTPLVPTVLSELTLGPNATVATAYGSSNFVLDHLSVVDIIVKNGDVGKHPFHLHGHKYQLVNRATDYTSNDPSLNPPLVEGQPNPVRRDTVAVPSGSSATLRVVADNPGAWFFHCHIEWHLESGLAVTFTEAPLQAQERAQTLAPPSSLQNNCAALGWKTSGNAAGHASATDLTGLPTGPFQQNNGWHPKGILAMFGCVLTATLGMASVVWYALGGGLSDEEVEDAWRKKRAARETRGKYWGLGKALGRS